MVPIPPTRDIKLVASLCWYDEPVDFLERCVTSLAGVADQLVTVDGAWRGYSGGVISPVEQADAIRDAATAAGVPVVMWNPNRPWRSQVEKRAAAMELAAEVGDWVLVIDGDEFVDPVSGPNPRAVRAALAKTELDVATVMLRSLNRPWPLKHLAPMVIPHRRLYRAGATVAGPAHNCYRLGERWLNGDPGKLVLEAALDLSQFVTIAHDNGMRSAARLEAARVYRRARRASGVEVYA